MTIAFASNPNKRFAASQIYQTPFTPAPTVDPYFEYTTLLLPGTGSDGQTNNSFLDSGTGNSGGPFTVSRQGNPTQGTFSPFSQTGWGNYFDGSGDYLAASSTIIPATGDVTIETWLYPTGAPTPTIVYMAGAGASSDFSFYYNSSGAIGVETGNAYRETATGLILLNTWQHLALTKSGSTYKIFLNGSEVTFTGGALAGTLTQSTLNIGGLGTLNSFAGYLSNLRITQSIVYTANFTPPTAPLTAISGTSLLTCQSNRFIDNSTNNFTITVNGNTSVVAFSPFNPTASWSAATYGGSGYFDGSGDSLTTPTVGTTIGTGDYCLEGWVYTTNATASFTAFILINTSSNYGIYLQVSGNAGRFLDFLNPNSNYVITGGTVRSYEWVHLVGTRQSGNMRLFVNGVLVAYQANNNYNYGTAGTIQIPPAVAQYLSGIRVNIGSVPSDYQTSQTVANTQVFTPPTAPLTAITNTSLLLNFTNAGIYDATSKNDLETVGDAQISNTTAKWGSTSIKFDGTGDYLTNNNASNPLLAFGTGDFTIEGWFYSNDASSATQRGMFQTSDTIGGLKTTYTTGVSMYHGSTGELNVNVGSTVYSTSGASITTGAWFYFAITRSSGNVNVYINGVSRASGSGNTNNLTGTYISVGGIYNTSFLFNGYIQDLRITRYARTITASPTAPFPTL